MKTTNKRIKAEIIKDGFTWGKLVRFHEIGKYLIVEFKGIKFDGVSPVTHREYENKSSFHPYYIGYDFNTSYESLDSAIVGVIAMRHDGHNTKADRYFMKAIK